MLSAPLAPLLVWLLMGTVPSSGLRPCTQDRHRIELKQDAPQDLQEVCISAGLVTTLLFDSRIHSGQIELEAIEGFTEVEAKGRLLTLVPSSRLAVGRRLRLSVRFEDGEAPAGATFILVVDPLRAERQVEVFRPRRALEICRRELNVVNARVKQLQLEVEHLPTCTPQARNLERTALSKMKNEGEFIVRNLSKSVTWDDKAVVAVKIIRYRPMHSTEPLLLQVELTLPRNDQPLRVVEGRLNAIGMAHQLHPKVWQEPPFSSDGLYLLLEVQVDLIKPHTLYDLTVETQEGKKFIIGMLAVL